MSDSTLERSIQVTGSALLEAASGRSRESSWFNERIMEWAISHPSFRTELFRFVDVYPATVDDEDVLEHLAEYLGGGSAPRIVDLAVEVAERVPFGDRVSAEVSRRLVERMARQFIVGSEPADALRTLAALWDRNIGFSVDLLGEHTLSDAEASRYALRLQDLLRTTIDTTAGWSSRPLLEHDSKAALPRANISVKPSALSASYHPLTRATALNDVADRLQPLLAAATNGKAFVWFDMENFDVKDITIELFHSLLSLPEYEMLDAGIVVQGYLRDSFEDLHRLIEWARERKHPVGVRLVRGAYWDSEVIRSGAMGWPVPVYRSKAETDLNYELCIRLMIDNHDVIRPAFGTHNVRSIAYAVEYARQIGAPADSYEIQLLFGMAGSLRDAVAGLGCRTRVYAPVGELIPGMAYLVRRLLENTANESFVRARVSGHGDAALVLRPPLAADPDPTTTTAATTGARHSAANHSAANHSAEGPPAAYSPEAPAEWRRGSVRQTFGRAVSEFAVRSVIEVGPRIDGARRSSADVEIVETHDPAQLGRVVARTAYADLADVDRAVERARGAWTAWRRTDVAERAGVLLRAAQWMRERRFELAAVEIFEVGKPWADADADVCEAIDFCEYYAREALRLSKGGMVQSPPGERNTLHYEPRGVGAVISPWNFPLAIPIGMVSAALVMGNAVVFKPAEQAPAMAALLVDAFIAAGLPAGLLSMLPGRGEDIGAALVAHPQISFVAFTGSRAVGSAIIYAAGEIGPGQSHVKRVVAEMGGKNPIIVDTDADLDVAVPAILTSAFGYAGQKCSAASRLITIGPIADAILDRLVNATSALKIGHPSAMATDVGPLIDREAYERVRGLVAAAHREGHVLIDRNDVPDDGYFVGPLVVDALAPKSSIITDEIFGPVLAVQRAHDLDHALALANDTPFALTAGIVSRTPSHIRHAAAELRAGNVYVNRSITGAVVGRQPFGGWGLSGVGSKAGGPDYLLQFTDPRVVTENLVRQGFAPAD